MTVDTNSTGLGSDLPKSEIHKSVDNVSLTSSAQTMSSVEIAELTSKQHKNVLADVRKMLESLGCQPAEFSARYIDAQGEARECFKLPKRETLVLVSGYSTELRAKIIDRWIELESQKRLMTPAEAHLEQAKLMVAIERRQGGVRGRAVGAWPQDRGDRAPSKPDRNRH